MVMAYPKPKKQEEENSTVLQLVYRREREHSLSWACWSLNYYYYRYQ